MMSNKDRIDKEYLKKYGAKGGLKGSLGNLKIRYEKFMYGDNRVIVDKGSHARFSWLKNPNDKPTITPRGKDMLCTLLHFIFNIMLSIVVLLALPSGLVGKVLFIVVIWLGYLWCFFRYEYISMGEYYRLKYYDKRYHKNNTLIFILKYSLLIPVIWYIVLIDMGLVDSLHYILFLIIVWLALDLVLSRKY